MAEIIDAWPIEIRLRAVRGDPFAFRLVLRDDDGQVVDVTGWEWRATVRGYGPGAGVISLDFEYLADETGVRLWLRGDETERLSTLRAWPVDVSCRQPSAGEGVMVAAGEMVLRSRVSDPLRHDPDLTPRDDELVPR